MVHAARVLPNLIKVILSVVSLSLLISSSLSSFYSILQRKKIKMVNLYCQMRTLTHTYLREDMKIEKDYHPCVAVGTKSWKFDPKQVPEKLFCFYIDMI